MFPTPFVACMSAGVLLLGACTTTPTATQKEQAGMVLGGVLGGALGSQIGGGEGKTAAIILGTIAGAAIGGSVGKSMAETDRLKTAQALETTRTGNATRWKNPDSGNEYVIVPDRTYTTSSGPCRDYTMDAIVNGKKEKILGTACRQPDGSWQNKNP
jgi:surface antigen